MTELFRAEYSYRHLHEYAQQMDKRQRRPATDKAKSTMSSATVGEYTLIVSILNPTLLTAQVNHRYSMKT